ncbi:hypothetical protein Tco_1131413 [Tanacetum coccineum]
MAAFKLLETQFQKFIKSQTYLDDEYVVMIRKYFLEYIQLEIREFCDTLIQHMEYMQTTEEKVYTSKALDASLVETESSRIESGEQDTSSRSRNDAHDDNADIRPIYDEELMAESERPRISKPRFTSQVDVNNDLSKPVTTHYFPKEREAASTKPHHVIASSNYKNSSKNMPRLSSNDMVYNHYLEEAKNKTHDKGRNSKPSVMPSARSQRTTNDFKPKPKINNRKSQNWPASKSSCIPTGKIFESSTTKVNSEPLHGSNTDITNLQECIQTLDSSAGTSINVQEEQNLDLSADAPVTRTASAAAKPCQEDSIEFYLSQTIFILINEELLYGGGGISFQLKSDSLPHSHAQTTKTYHMHQDSRIMKAQELKTKTSANSDIKDNSSETKLQGRLLASFQDDAKYEHVGQDARSQGGKDGQD